MSYFVRWEPIKGNVTDVTNKLNYISYSAVVFGSNYGKLSWIFYNI